MIRLIIAVCLLPQQQRAQHKAQQQEQQRQQEQHMQDQQQQFQRQLQIAAQAAQTQCRMDPQIPQVRFRDKTTVIDNWL